MPEMRLVAFRDQPLADRIPIAVAHGMMVAAEHILCPMRCILMMPRRPGDPAYESTYWYLVIAAAGAIGELRDRLLNHRHYRPTVEQYLVSMGKPQSVLNRLTAPDLSSDIVLSMCERIRKKHWAHWDYHVSLGFVQGLRFDGTDMPVATTSGDATIESTGSPWVREAWFLDLERTFALSEAEVLARTHELTALLSDAAMLARDAAVGILHAAGVSTRIQPVTPGEHDTAGSSPAPCGPMPNLP